MQITKKAIYKAKGRKKIYIFPAFSFMDGLRAFIKKEKAVNHKIYSL